MANIKAVIGANYGDEGKGLMTDYFANQAKEENKSCLVVCHNGGAQRGHTVVTPDGVRHVFRHFGSGSLVGADTYLSSEYIINPITFRKEREKLLGKVTKMPKCYVNPNCRITLPYDMLINQIIELDRGENRHGSCGMGIWETIVRNNERTFALRVGEIERTFLFLYFFLISVKNNYLTKRLSVLGVKNINLDMFKSINSPALIDHYIQDIFYMLDNISFASNDILKSYDTIIFESGQGLQLDQNRTENQPNTTPSNTGLQNPISILKSLDDFNISSFEACYVSRSYETRHGAGNFPTECGKMVINSIIKDFTNQPNEFQGEIRYGTLDIPRLLKRIQEDVSFGEDYDIDVSIALTHLNENVVNIKPDFPCSFHYSYSQTREDIVDR